MDTIHDLYTFAAKYRIHMQSALKRANLSPNYAHRLRSGVHKSPDAEKFRRLRDTLIRMAKESGAYKPGSISDEVAGIREALDRIESAAGGRHG